MAAPVLQADALVKQYMRGWFPRRSTFRLEADFSIDCPQIVGMMGPNGSGKTTLFELITGSNRPTSGTVRVAGQDIHRVRVSERDRVAIHYHQSYQVRRFRRTKPDFLMERAGRDSPLIHLFDEPQFNTQDGYIGFMLDFFRRLRAEGRLVFVCLHPTAQYHLDILREVCESFVFVEQGRVSIFADFAELTADPRLAGYLGQGVATGIDRLAGR